MKERGTEGALRSAPGDSSAPLPDLQTAKQKPAGPVATRPCLCWPSPGLSRRSVGAPAKAVHWSKRTTFPARGLVFCLGAVLPG